jgi:CubicO group peptidase (beta-lactamase class C family)
MALAMAMMGTIGGGCSLPSVSAVEAKPSLLSPQEVERFLDAYMAQPEMVFPIASISKVVTATAVNAAGGVG